MNRKGFTLIELLAVIILIGIVSVFVIPSVLDYYDNSKKSSYNILIKNIKIAAENYYTECEYDSNSNIECEINSNELQASIGSLAKYGFLTPSREEENILIVEDPRDSNNNLNDCYITIGKSVDENYIVTYRLIPAPYSSDYCPTDEDYGSEQ